MKPTLAILALAGCALTGQALAQTNCAPTPPTSTGGRVTNGINPNLTNALLNKTVCAARNGETWQEFHASGGRVIDYKRGPTNAVDPSEDVGSWSISNNIVTYNYGGGGSYSYALYRDSNSPTSFYHFCGTSPAGNNVVNATIRSGQVPCN